MYQIQISLVEYMNNVVILKKKSAKQRKITLTRINRTLSISLIVLGAYILISPFLPKILFYFSAHDSTPYGGKLSSYYEKDDNQPIPQENRLVIPSLSINEEIKEGPGIDVINSNGVWRRPASSNNPDISNMVVVGHRFLYTNPRGTFYNLDKLSKGAKLAIYWQGAEHVYEVSSSYIVDPNDKSVETPSSEPELTLYTCTPLITASHRLVIKAKEIK